MKPKLKELWLAALRSGEIGQAKGTLKNSRGHMCCLGVLAHVCVKNNMVPKGLRIEETSGRIIVSMGLEESQGNLGALNALAPRFGLEVDTADTLVNHNDSGRYFNYIADWIEENVK